MVSCPMITGQRIVTKHQDKRMYHAHNDNDKNTYRGYLKQLIIFRRPVMPLNRRQVLVSGLKRSGQPHHPHQTPEVQSIVL